MTTEKRNYNVFFNTHTVSGIIISVGLFVCFFAGAFALFLENINHWEANAKNKAYRTDIDYERVLQTVEKEGYNMQGRNFFINLREAEYIRVFSRPLPVKTDSTQANKPQKNTEKAALANAAINLRISPETYQIEKLKSGNKTGKLGDFLYHLHYFNQIPNRIGLYLAGFVALFFLFAIVTGVIVHWKKIISNFFTFRLKARMKNLWADAHTALGVIGLPFQFIYAVSGAFYGLAILLYLPTTAILFDGNQEEMFSYVAPGRKSFEKANEKLDKRQNINRLAKLSLDKIGNPDMEFVSVNISNYNDKNAILNVEMYEDTDKSFYNYSYVSYRLSDGEIVGEKPMSENTYKGNVLRTMGNLHFARYGGYFIKAIYFVLALITCFVILSGVMVWIEARSNKKYEAKRKFNTNVCAIYLGATIGLFPAIALFFCLTKILPLDIADRFSTMSTVFFLFWLGYAIYAYLLKDFHSINKHALILAGFLGLAIPVLNGIQSGLWFWKSLKSGYVDSFFIDISWLFLGFITLLTAFSVQRLASHSKSLSSKPKEEHIAIPVLQEPEPYPQQVN